MKPKYNRIVMNEQADASAPEQLAGAATATAPHKARKSRVVSIIAATAALADAIEMNLAPKMKGWSFEVVPNVSKRSAGSVIATVGLPSFLPNTEGVTILSLSTAYEKDATTESRKAQWDVIRNPESAPEEILAVLGTAQEYSVTPGKLLNESKLAISDVRIRIAEAETDEERLAAYKEGFEALMGLVV